MSNPFSGQQFLQQGTGNQTLAQGSSPFLANNGNPNTIYNTAPPQGGYLPPVSNAYDQWRINPLATAAASPFGPLYTAPALPFPMPNFGGGGGGFGGGWTSNPGGGGGAGGGGGTPPTTPIPGQGAGGNLFPVGSGGWMLGGPQPSFATGGGSLNTSYTQPGLGFGLMAPQFAGAWNISPGGYGNVGSFGNALNGFGNTAVGQWIRNPTGVAGEGLDFLIPGDAIQGGMWNPGNVIAGTIDQTIFGGIPLTENFGSRLALNRMLNNPDGWLATSDSNTARGLRNWAALNGFERIGGADAYRQMIEAIRAGGGNINQLMEAMAARVRGGGIPISNDQALRDAAQAALARAVQRAQDPRAIYASQGVAGLARAGFTPAQINQISGGIGLGASGAFTSGAVTTVLNGDAARGAFEAMRNAQRAGVFQRHDRLN